MKKVIIGLVAGIVICGGAFMVEYPTIKKDAYDSGFEAGNKAGIATGTTAGIAQGVADMKALQKQQHDSLAKAEQKQEAVRKAAMVPKKKPEILQNWHVIDGSIADPVIDTATHKVELKKK